jgi:hypothetical protein
LVKFPSPKLRRKMAQAVGVFWSFAQNSVCFSPIPVCIREMFVVENQLEVRRTAPALRIAAEILLFGDVHPKQKIAGLLYVYKLLAQPWDLRSGVRPKN